MVYQKISLIFLLITGNSFGTEEALEKEKTYVDDAHKKISSSILFLSNRIDAFFGSQRADDEANGSRLRILTRTTFQQNQKPDQDADLRFTLRLPHLESFFKFKFKKEFENSEEEKNENDKKKISPSEEQLYKRSSKWTFNFNTGVRLGFPTNIFSRARLRKTITLFDAIEFNPTQEAIWSSKEGFGLNFFHDIDYPFSNTYLLRLVNSAFWRDETDAFTTSHGPILFQQLTNRRAISYSFIASGSGKPKLAILNYSVAINYRQLLHSDWAFITLGPSLSFPKERQWEEIYAIFIGLEAVFGTL